ncbi:MAG TPA: VCBS repeat-containing protein [Acetobacteraceae bacterium]|jgi:hypothetical protein|nr:VCBS repeat-containing protein [Acetobacteraceae bacterium]
MATVDGRVLVGTRYRDIIGVDDPEGAPPRGDFVIPGPGNDYLIADVGADVFGFVPGDGVDFIDDFEPGVDKLQFGGGLSASSLSIQPLTLAGVPGLAIYYSGPGGPDAVFVARVSALGPTDIEFGDLPGRYFDPPPADLNVDGRSDAVFRSTAGAVELWTMNGASAVRNTLGSIDPAARLVGTGDFDGSLRQGVLYQQADGTPVAWQVAGTGVAQQAVLLNPGPQWRAVDTGHFNADVSTDILWRHEDGRVAVWFMQVGDGLRGPFGVLGSSAVVAQPGPEWQLAGTADVDGDARADILWQTASGAVVVWHMDGGTIGKASLLGLLGSGARVLGGADFNGDDRDDLYIRQADGTLTIWQTNGSSVTAVTDVARLPGNATAITAADYDGNGRAEFLVQGADGAVTRWVPDGTLLTSGTPVASPGADWQLLA